MFDLRKDQNQSLPLDFKRQARTGFTKHQNNTASDANDTWGTCSKRRNVTRIASEIWSVGSMHREGTLALLKMRRLLLNRYGFSGGLICLLPAGKMRVSVSGLLQFELGWRATKPKLYSHSMTCRHIHQARHSDIYLIKNRIYWFI